MRPHSLRFQSPLKNKARARFAACASMLCVALGLIFAGCRGDRRESFYPSFAEARSAGATDRGWIPDFLPTSSIDIHEIHEISPSVGWCAFDFAVRDSQALRSQLKRINELPVTLRRVPSPGTSWWPTVLQGNLNIEKIQEAGFDLYVYVKPETSVTTDLILFAIDWRTGRGFFYLTPAAGPTR